MDRRPATRLLVLIAVALVATACGAVPAATIGPRPAPPTAADRPFLFALRDVPTGAILFLGRVTDPSVER